MRRLPCNNIPYDKQRIDKCSGPDLSGLLKEVRRNKTGDDEYREELQRDNDKQRSRRHKERSARKERNILKKKEYQESE